MPCLSPRWATVECALFKSFSLTTFMISDSIPQHHLSTYNLCLSPSLRQYLGPKPRQQSCCDMKRASTWTRLLNFLLPPDPGSILVLLVAKLGHQVENLETAHSSSNWKCVGWIHISHNPCLFLTFDIFDNSLYYFSSSPGLDSDSILLTSLS